MKAIGHKRPRDDLNHKYIWHLRLSHMGEGRLNKLKNDGILNSLNSESYPVYESYLLRKMTKLSFAGHRERAIKLLIWVHTDVYGPFDVQARGGY